MKILFIMPAVDVGYPNQIGALSAFLKKNGHLTDYLELLYDTEIEDSHLAKIRLKIENFNPDLIGFSAYEMTFPQIVKCSNFIKRYYKMPIIVGGYYPTLAPDEIFTSESIDIVCRGEGEYPLLELLEALQQDSDYTKIHNLWIRQNGKIIKNSIRPLIEDLNILPFSDRSLNYTSSASSELDIMASRGCPFNCSYCANHALKELYPNKEKYVRHRSVSNVILEIKECLKTDNYEAIRFKDETFTTKKKWIEEFCTAYKKDIGLPFICSINPETGSFETLKLLKESGCTTIQVGVESGDEILREKILCRKVTNSKLVELFNNTRKLGLKIKSYNMLGLPYETRLSRFKTILLNIRLRPYIIQTNFFYPFKGTRLGDECYRKGWINFEKKDRINFLNDDSIMCMSKVTKTELIITKWLNSGIALLSGNYHLLIPGLKLIYRLLKRKVTAFYKKHNIIKERV